MNSQDNSVKRKDIYHSRRGTRSCFTDAGSFLGEGTQQEADGSGGEGVIALGQRHPQLRLVNGAIAVLVHGIERLDDPLVRPRRKGAGLHSKAERVLFIAGALAVGHLNKA